MKRISILFCLAAIQSFVFAQAPDKMSYQAVIRNTSNNLVTSSPVGMQISILQGSPVGTAVYVERQTPNTNTNGLATIDIGSGTIITGNFASIDWTNGPYFIKTETDPSGGTNYTITGTSQLLSVPYALYAKKAGNGFSGDYNDLTNAPTNVSSFTNDAGYLTSEVDGSVTNELQTISRTGTTVTLSNGGGSYTDSVNVYTAGSGINITGNVISTSTTGVHAIGDVKQSYQSGDHNGWYLLDGRLLTSLPAVAQSNAASLGITTNLPDATNRFLADISSTGSTGGSNTVTLTQANLPNVTFNGTAASAGAHNHTVDPPSTTTSSNGAHQHNFVSTVNDVNNSTSQGWPNSNIHNGIRTTDRNDMSIANNIIQSSGAHTHTLDVASFLTTTDGAHSHSVTVSSGGTGTAVTITPSYLSVNAFIYLGP